MIPYPFTYRRPRTLAEAQAELSRASDGKLIAGGQTLIATMKQRLANPAVLIDIGRLDELRFLRRERDRVVIGAGVTHCAVSAAQEVKEAISALARLAGSIGDPAVRHLGTLGGSLANNDPAADYPAAALALDATVTTTQRDIGADDFFQGMFSTALEDGEIIKEVAFPIPQAAGYAKFRNPASRYALAGVFVAKHVQGVRVAVTGAAPSVFRLTAMEEALSESFSPDAIAEISVSPDSLNSDLHASAEYRAHLVGVMAKRAILDALGQ